MRLQGYFFAIAACVCVAHAVTAHSSGTVTAHTSGMKSIGKLPAFLSGGQLRLQPGRGVLGLSACAQNENTAVNRRAVLASVAFGLTGLMPVVSRAQPLSASEAEEYARLLEQVMWKITRAKNMNCAAKRSDEVFLNFRIDDSKLIFTELTSKFQKCCRQKKSRMSLIGNSLSHLCLSFSLLP
jgi:hypothetical protein